MSQDENKEQFILSQKSDWNKRLKNNVHNYTYLLQIAHSFALEFSVLWMKWKHGFLLGSYRFIQQHIMRGTDPRAILKDLLPETVLPPDLDDMTLWQIIINISEPPKRKKRKDINTLEDVVRLLNERKKVLVLTGAGVCFWFSLWNAFWTHAQYIEYWCVPLVSAGVCFLWDSWLSV